MSDETSKPRFCKDCKYHEPAGNASDPLHYCTHPRESKYDLVTGEMYHVQCHLMRDGSCGYTALLFEPKEQGI